MLNALHLPASNPLAFINLPMGAEWIVIGALGLLIFGKRLPDVGKGIGSAIANFKKGLKGVEEEIEEASDTPAQPAKLTDQGAPSATPAHKFDPYTGKPIEQPKAKFDPYTGKPVAEETTAS
jgi:sec-independent protein translocase protein TatA